MADVRRCAGELAAFFRIAAQAGAHSGGTPRELASHVHKLVQGLETSLVLAGQDGTRGCLQPLLELADTLAAYTQLNWPQPAVPASTADEAGASGERSSAELELRMLYSAAYTSTLLLHYALPACGGSDDDRRRVLAGGAVLATGAQALPRLFPHGLTAPGAAAAGVEAAAQLHSQAAAYHLTLSQLLDGMWRALRLPELPPQLQRPQSLHVWLRDVLGAMQPVKGSVLMGLGCLYPANPFLACLAALGAREERLEDHMAAVCADRELMSELASLTAAIYADHPRWHLDFGPLCADQALTDLLRWVGSWPDLPWPEGSERAQPAAVQVAAARILQGEARRVGRAAPPETPQEVRQWQLAVEAIAALSRVVLGPYWAAQEEECGYVPGPDAEWEEEESAEAAAAAAAAARHDAKVAGASRQRRVLLALGEAAPAIVRSFPAAAAVLGGSAAAAPAQSSQDAGGLVVPPPDADSLQGTLCALQSSVRHAVHDLSLAPCSSWQRQQLLDALLALATALAWLAGQLPQAVHALNGGRGPACPADGCSCHVCRAPEQGAAGAGSSPAPPSPAAGEPPGDVAAGVSPDRAAGPLQQAVVPSSSRRRRVLVLRAEEEAMLFMPGVHQLDAGNLIGSLNTVLGVLLSCATKAELAWAGREGRAARLAVACCKLPHALCGLSSRHREALHVCVPSGLFPMAVASLLLNAVLCGARCLLGMLCATRPHAGDAEAAAAWDRQYVCCLLEATAAMAVGWQLTPNNAWNQAVKHGPREGVVSCLAQLEAPAASLALVSTAQGEGAVLTALGRHLCGEEGRRHLPALLERLLPPEGEGGGSEGAGPPPQPLPVEAAVFQARALGQAHRRCANVRCPAPPAGEDLSEGRGKRCGGCGAVRYCSVACSKQDWRAHRAACRALQAGGGDGGVQ